MRVAILQRFGLAHIAFLATLGLAGWLATVVLSISPGDLVRPWELTWEFTVCLALAGLARLWAVVVFERVPVALDSAFYVSAAYVFGTVAAAWIVLLVLTFDGIVRFLRGTGVVAPGETPARHVAAQFLHHGGLPALVVLGIGVVLDVDHVPPGSDLRIAWTLVVFAVTFLAIHYALVGGSRWFLGAASRALWKQLFVKVVVAELALVPLALAMVLGHVHQGIEMYLLLGVTCLLFNAVFRQATVSSAKLAERVSELATLNKVGHIISACLDREKLVGNIARETLRLVRHTSRFMIGLLDPEQDEVLYQLFNEAGENYRQIVAPATDGLSGWVMANREALLLGEIEGRYRQYSRTTTYYDPNFHSWLGVPLAVGEEVVGVISVQSEQRNAYTGDHLRALTTIADQAAVALENARLYELATLDGLTGLLVRRHFDQRLKEEWIRSARYGNPFTVGIFDLDGFKGLNDTYGHQLGDHVLRAAAGILKRNMRGADLAARFGGDEFAFLLPRTALAEAWAVAERIRTEIAAMALQVTHEERPANLGTTASIGMAGHPDCPAGTVAELIAEADAAMYDAKRLGKNRICVATHAASGNDIPLHFPLGA